MAENWMGDLGMVLKLGLKGVHQRHHYCDGLARRVLAGFKHPRARHNYFAGVWEGS